MNRIGTSISTKEDYISDLIMNRIGTILTDENWINALSIMFYCRYFVFKESKGRREMEREKKQNWNCRKHVGRKTVFYNFISISLLSAVRSHYTRTDRQKGAFKSSKIKTKSGKCFILTFFSLNFRYNLTTLKKFLVMFKDWKKIEKILATLSCWEILDQIFHSN